MYELLTMYDGNINKYPQCVFTKIYFNIFQCTRKTIRIAVFTNIWSKSRVSLIINSATLTCVAQEIGDEQGLVV